MKYVTIFIQLLFLSLLGQSAFANGDSEFYKAKDGNVDPATFIGWSAFHNTCVSCHGVGATGTEAGPDLTEITDRLSPAQFRLRVLHRKVLRFTSDDWRAMEQALYEEIIKQEKRDQGELAKMPRWEYNPVVTEYVDNIYRYLKARADGAIGPDKPGILKE